MSMSLAKLREDRIETLHPAGKKGVRIDKTKYEEMRRALLRVIPKRRSGVAFGDLSELVAEHLSDAVFGGASLQWYVVTVKQDLEARGLIEQVEGVRPQHVRRTQSARGGSR
jgi:hypothetical protein